MKAIYTALASFQQEMPAIKKNANGYGYKFADLDEITKSIKPLMAKYKLGFTQPIDGTKLKTILFHYDSGESIEGCAEIPQGVALKGQNEFQTMGSAITYLRRYGLVSILGLVTDEDADAAGETKRRAPEPKTRNMVEENAAFMRMTADDVATTAKKQSADDMKAPTPEQFEVITRLAKLKGLSDGDITNRLMLIDTSKMANDTIAKLQKEVGNE